MIMQLYALCLHPLLTLLKGKVARLQIGRNGRHIAAVAYADDVTLFVMSPKDLIIKDIIHTFEMASGARLNPHKSKVLAIAGWDATDTGLGIDFQPSIKILGITFTSTIARSAQLFWEPLTSLIQAQARLTYGRKLCIAQRVQYVQTTLLSRIWYMTQIFPPSIANTNLLTTVILWFIWQGMIFRVPTSTLQKTKQQGGRSLVDIAAKCKTLLLNRMWLQSMKEGTATAAWLYKWNISGPQA
jgi:hypothetical protein